MTQYQHVFLCQVLSRGHLVTMKSLVCNTDGNSLLVLDKHLQPDLTPSMRVVAFFPTDFSNSTYQSVEQVMDTLQVDIPDICVEEVSY